VITKLTPEPDELKNKKKLSKGAESAGSNRQPIPFSIGLKMVGWFDFKITKFIPTNHHDNDI